MACRLCGSSTPLVRAHIVPSSFYEIPKDEAIKILPSEDGAFPKKSQTGVYDSNIVCLKCEQSFSPYDSYAHRTLLTQREKLSPVRHEGTVIAWSRPNFDYPLLKLFFLSLLWRASASSHVVYAGVQLGPHEDCIASLIRSADPGSPEEYSVVLARFPTAMGMLNPQKERHCGINFYRLYLAEYVAIVKVDRRNTPDPFESLALGAEPALTVIALDPAHSKDAQLLAAIKFRHR